MDKLYELKEKLCKELEQFGSKELSAGSLDVIDKLAHAIKNIDKVIEAKESEGGGSFYSGEGSMRSMQSGRGSFANRSYAGGGSYANRGSYRGNSRAEYSQKRDSMGRYSKDDEMMAELRKLHSMANDEMQRESIEKLMEICETM